MEKNLNLPEVTFGTQDAKGAARLRALVKSRAVRKIAPRLYTSNFIDEPAEVIRRNLLAVLGGLFPGSVLSHRSAFEFRPTEDHKIFVTTSYTKKVKLPGLTVHLLEGPGPEPEDTEVAPGLHVSHEVRALLENCSFARQQEGSVKVLTRAELEDKLDRIVRTQGEGRLNEIRDSARNLAHRHNMVREFETLNRRIGALLSTRPSAVLTSSAARARALGLAFDPGRIVLFEVLFNTLSERQFAYIPGPTEPDVVRNFAFFEAYFSNYIEGTTFEVSEAREIVDRNLPMPSRPEDSHDILGTFRIVSNVLEMSQTPSDLATFTKLLRARHQVLMSARAEAHPGTFKTQTNRAGSSIFVAPELVQGTLAKSLEYYHALNHPFARAAYLMFVVSEIHPFRDGNGRIARIMMNAELVRAQQQKVLIPTSFRTDYLLTLKRLSRHGDPIAYIKMLQRAQAYSSMLHFSEFDEFNHFLKQSNAFDEEGRTLRFGAEPFL